MIGGTARPRRAPVAGKAAHLEFGIRPAGRGAPRIDPKPILDGWKLLEATAIYRASGRNVLYGQDGGRLLDRPDPAAAEAFAGAPRALRRADRDLRRRPRGHPLGPDRPAYARHDGLPRRVGPAPHGHQPEVRPRLLHQLGQRLPPLLGQRGGHRQDQRRADHRPPGARRGHRSERAAPDATPGHRRTRPDHLAARDRRRHLRDGRPRTTTSTSASSRCSAPTASSASRPWPCSSPDNGPTCSTSCGRSRTPSCPPSRPSTRCRPRSGPRTPTRASNPSGFEMPSRLDARADLFAFVQFEFGFLLGPGDGRFLMAARRPTSPRGCSC